jgi:hypothetical protein
VPELGLVEIAVLVLFLAWCVGVFFFLRRMSARGEKSAAEPDPARRGMDELIDRVEKGLERDSEP